MSETKQQRSFGVVAAIIVAVAGLLKFGDVAPDERLGAAMLFVVGVLVGFGVMYARERWLAKSGRRPLDKPSSGVLVAFYAIIIGLVALFRLLTPQIQVASYGLMLGVSIGFATYIGRDLQRLRPSPTAPDPDE